MAGHLPRGATAKPAKIAPIASLPPVSAIPRRSVGCAACRQRRIACDGKRPKCKNCADYGADCVGWPLAAVNGPSSSAHGSSNNSTPSTPTASRVSSRLHNIAATSLVDKIDKLPMSRGKKRPAPPAIDRTDALKVPKLSDALGLARSKTVLPGIARVASSAVPKVVGPVTGSLTPGQGQDGPAADADDDDDARVLAARQEREWSPGLLREFRKLEMETWKWALPSPTPSTVSGRERKAEAERESSAPFRVVKNNVTAPSDTDIPATKKTPDDYRAITPAPATVVDVAPARVVDVAPARVVDVAPARVVDVAPAKVGDIAPARVIGIAPAVAAPATSFNGARIKVPEGALSKFNRTEPTKTLAKPSNLDEMDPSKTKSVKTSVPSTLSEKQKKQVSSLRAAKRAITPPPPNNLLRLHHGLDKPKVSAPAMSKPVKPTFGLSKIVSTSSSPIAGPVIPRIFVGPPIPAHPIKTFTPHLTAIPEVKNYYNFTTAEMTAYRSADTASIHAEQLARDRERDEAAAIKARETEILNNAAAVAKEKDLAERSRALFDAEELASGTDCRYGTCEKSLVDCACEARVPRRRLEWTGKGAW
ncbi:hypothetical protein E4T42_00686 [Aureobasidium subglaciale]|nr:hypothetical protein E4T42_00686 [Aureobasidium subglaciale]